MKTFIVNRNTLDLAGTQRDQIVAMSKKIPSLSNDVVIYNCSQIPFKGKLYGHYQALLEHTESDCDYYWFNHPDLTFCIDMNCLKTLLEVMEQNKEIGVLSPGHNTKYPNQYKKSVDWHKVASCDYLSLLIQGDVIRSIGFLNPVFEYSRGAILEYSYKVYKNGWCVAYCDIANVYHYGGTTYGKKGEISREEYKHRAIEFARYYLRTYYGCNWDRLFAKELPKDVVNTYVFHKRSIDGRELVNYLFLAFNRFVELYLNKG